MYVFFTGLYTPSILIRYVRQRFVSAMIYRCERRLPSSAATIFIFKAQINAVSFHSVFRVSKGQGLP